MATILLVEDEQSLADSLISILKERHYNVLHAASGADAKVLIQSNPDLVVLDWGLPDCEGIDLLRAWRAEGIAMPIIFLSARTEVIDRIVGLELGANDFMSKPCEVRELLTRIKVQLRDRTPGETNEKKLTARGIELLESTREVKFHGEPVKINNMEFMILKFFLENPNRVFTREELLNRIWGYDAYSNTRTVDNHIVLLRQKFGEDSIETIRRVGYRFKK